MNTFTEFYMKQAKQLQKEHDEMVASNWKLRSIEEALRQIKSVGDIDITPAAEVLKAEYQREQARNKKISDHAYALKEFVRNMEIEAKEHDYIWSESTRIFGY